jgi:type IV pilus assembly protein PilE
MPLDRTHVAGAQQGFNLIELLVTVAIVAILAAIAYPSYEEQVRAARRSEMQAELMALAQQMERLYTEAGCYNPGDEDDCGSPRSPSIATANDYYDLGFNSLDAGAFSIQATPRADGPQAADGIMRIDHIGRRFWDENGDGDVADPGEDDWTRG